METLSVLSLNCHGFDLGTSQYLHRVSQSMDIILLQETWLCEANCYKLSEAFSDYNIYHSSAMEEKLSLGIMSGRPFGGTAVLVHKRLAKRTFQLITNCHRLTAVRCSMPSGADVIFSSVYMPFNDCSTDYYIEFEAVVGVMQGLADKCLGCKFVFGGDYNCIKGSNNRSCDILNGLCQGNSFRWLDPDTGGVDYTFHNDTLNRFTLIDYFVCSSDLVNSSVAGYILNDGDNTSDHLAIVCQFTIADMFCDVKGRNHCPVKLLWDKANLDAYQSLVCSALSCIELPVDALLCTTSNCQIHCEQIEQYYTDIVRCLNLSSQCIPSVKVGFQKHWWHPDLDDLKQTCIDITSLWSSLGRPRSGLINAERLKCKYRYKQAIKVAMQDNDRAFNDDLFEYLCRKDDVSFWKAWRKRFCSNYMKPTNIINGKCGTNNVLNEFSKYFSGVGRPNTMNADLRMADEVQQLLCENENVNSMIPQVNIGDVVNCISHLKLHKAAGHDNITNEHLIYGGSSLAVHLSLLFTSMIRHCYVPNDFCNSIIVPLLKSKHGDATSLDMYRGITLSPVLSKVFESVLLHLYDEFLSSDPLQFGFKKNSSCSHALFTLTEAVKYFTKKDSRVYCAFLDASKAFDKVLHNGLFLKLLKRGVPVVFVRLLQNWYSRLRCCVKWNNEVGEFFPVLCGVRQGGVLSPYLFSVYVNDLIVQLRQTGHGIHIGQVFVGCALYADDIALLSASCFGLQKLVDICTCYGVMWDIKFNPLKSQLITFGGYSPSRCVISLDGNPIPWVTKVKYLGVQLICNTGIADVSDVCRRFYGQFNNIMSVLGRQSNEISAVHLTKTYCLPTLMYGCEAWTLTDGSLHKLNTAWNNSFRRIFSCCWRESTRPLQFFCKSLPFYLLLEQRKLILWMKIRRSNNIVLQTLSGVSYHELLAICSKYDIDVSCMSENIIKKALWNAFAQTVDI